jgi:hypothetical protein
MVLNHNQNALLGGHFASKHWRALYMDEPSLGISPLTFPWEELRMFYIYIDDLDYQELYDLGYF